MEVFDPAKIIDTLISELEEDIARKLKEYRGEIMQKLEAVKDPAQFFEDAAGAIRTIKAKSLSISARIADALQATTNNTTDLIPTVSSRRSDREISDSLVSRLKAVMLRKRYKQAEIGKILGLDKTSISKVVNGQCGLASKRWPILVAWLEKEETDPKSQ